MKHIFASLLFVVGIFVAFTPQVAVAGLIPCGLTNDDVATPLPMDESAPCTVCHIVVAGNNLIKWGLGVMTVIAITVMFAMAVLYVVSAGNPGMMQTAKGGILASMIGFGIMLSAWLIVNTVLTILVSNADATKPLGGLVKGGTFSFACDQSSNAAKK
jgi:hypothetical protein